MCVKLNVYYIVSFNALQYKTERNGVIETRVEQKITIQSDGDPIDHDRALAEAIQVQYTVLIFNSVVYNKEYSNYFVQIY